MLDDPVGALRNAAAANVGLICTVVNVLEKPERTFEQLESWRQEAGGNVPQVHIIVGTHPHDASRSNAESLQLIRKYAHDPRVVGLGELGLDYYYDHSPREVQRRVFAEQIQLAHALDLPICIHLREAHEDGLRILKEQGVPAKGAILHCFGLEYEVAAPFLKLGCYVSFAGPVTFKKTDAVREAASRIPPNRILSETDCPFLAPEPVRGTKNEPANVSYIAQVLARAQEVSPEQFAQTVLDNARRLFGLS